MPRNTRQWAQRELDATVKNIDWAGTHLSAMEEIYRPQHPEIADSLIAIMDLLNMAQNTIIKLRGSF